MSEKEIISRVRISLSEINNYTSSTNETTIDKIYLQGLLALYNEEKEKNKNLLQLLNKSGIDTINLVNDVNNNYVYKDKIRELLKRYDKDIAWANADDHYYFVKFIKELLEED